MKTAFTSVWGLPIPYSTGGGSTTTINSTNQTAIPFSVSQSKTLNSFVCNVSAVTGTLNAGDIQIDIYGNASALPDTGSGSLGFSNTAVALPTTGSPAPVQMTGLNLSLNPNKIYWAVLKNNNASSATFTVKHGPSTTSPALQPLFPLPFPVLAQNWNGSAWSSTNSSGCYAAIFSDSSVSGQPFTGASGGAGSAVGAYGTQEAGVVFTTPANFNLNIAGASLVVNKQGSPTGTFTFRLYQGTTLLAETGAIDGLNTMGTSTNYATAFFSSAQALTGNTTYRITLHNNATDSSANYWGLSRYTLMNQTQALTLLPYSAKQTVTTNYTATPPTFTDTNTFFLTFALIPDQAAEFATGSTGGGPSGYAY